MLQRTIYGVEYVPRSKGEEPSGLGWIIALVAIATLVSLGISLGKKLHAALTAEPDTINVVVADGTPAAPDEPQSHHGEVRGTETTNETGNAAVRETAAAAAAAAPAVREEPPKPVAVAKPVTIAVGAGNRPVAVRNLLMRLEEAARRRDIHMEATTIEQLRSQPGAEDLDDKLARRLGTLNMKRLFDLKTREWVERVEVKRGDSSSRIASEHGTTFAAFSKLNGGKVDRVILGRKLYVMSRPKFSLTIHRRLRYADLKLNDKFFKRYDLRSEPRLGNGAYEWGKVYPELPLVERKELEMLLPRSTVTVISEL